MKYVFSKKDIEKAFSFAVKIHLDPNKAPVGRTSAEPRGFGATCDAWMSGKLVEIGVKKMIEKKTKSKSLKLDFELRNPSEVRIEPDIIRVIEKKTERSPNVFTEIKRASETDRWSGLTLDQKKSMIEGANGKEMYIISASLNCDNLKNNNPKSGDILGMYLKQITNNNEFNGFSDLNLYAKLEYVLSMNDLETFGNEFLKDTLFYETSIFNEVKNIFKKDGSLRSGISVVENKSFFNGKIYLYTPNGQGDDEKGIFNVKGDSFSILEKVNPKSIKKFILCHSNVFVYNKIFGGFHLKKGKVYQFNLFTVGRDPKLKRDNIFISKKRIEELIKNGEIQNPESRLEEISKNI